MWGHWILLCLCYLPSNTCVPFSVWAYSVLSKLGHCERRCSLCDRNWDCLMPTGIYEHPSTNIKVGRECASVIGLVLIVVMAPSLLEVWTGIWDLVTSDINQLFCWLVSSHFCFGGDPKLPDGASILTTDHLPQTTWCEGKGLQVKANLAPPQHPHILVWVFVLAAWRTLSGVTSKVVTHLVLSCAFLK